jgi:hypothetical protein
LKIPEDAQPGESYMLVMGLYQSATGTRADLLNNDGSIIGNEFVVGSVTIAPKTVPDQTCAMIPQSCAAQQ